jgi:hypothetical protein
MHPLSLQVTSTITNGIQLEVHGLVLCGHSSVLYFTACTRKVSSIVSCHSPSHRRSAAAAAAPVAAAATAAIVQRLLQLGCDAAATDVCGRVPLHWAAEVGFAGTVAALAAAMIACKVRFGGEGC